MLQFRSSYLRTFARHFTSKCPNLKFENIAASFASNQLRDLRSIDSPIFKMFFESNRQKLKNMGQLSSDLNSLMKEHSSESDAALKELFEGEIEELKGRLDSLDSELAESLFLCKNDNVTSVIVEIRPGTGGDEAAMFAKELADVYERYFEFKNWKYDILSESSNSEQIRELIYSVSGDSYADLQFETGVHRVQRVPSTDSQGRIHTSTVTVAVIPQNADDASEVLNEKDIRMDVFRSSGPGGQNVNKTNSAVRLVHIPTGITVSMQDERSQILNKMKGMQVLQHRLQERARSQKAESTKMLRSEQIGFGDRSEKIRTYNFPQNRITDHRSGFTTQNLPGFFEDPEVLDKFVETTKDMQIKADIKHLEDILNNIIK